MPVSGPVSRYQCYAGVDIAAASLRATWMAAGPTPVRPVTLDQTPAGCAALQARLLSNGHTAAAILGAREATGSYGIALATTLAQAGFVVAVVNPAQAPAVAKALLTRAKTDAIDARTLAQRATLLQPTPWAPPPAIDPAVQQGLTQREALVGVRQPGRHPLPALPQRPVVVAAVRDRMDARIATLDAQISAVEREMAQALLQESAWATAARCLRSLKGIGEQTAAWLLGSPLNVSACPTAAAATADAGRAPPPRDSGTSVRGRPQSGHTGTGRLRTALSLATLSAAPHPPGLTAFYPRLRAAGKPQKGARCAAARKLLHLAWAVVRTDEDGDPTSAQRHHAVA